MTGAGERHRMAGQDVAQKLAERTFPALRAVQPAEGTQGIDEVGGGAVGILVSSERSHRPSLLELIGLEPDAGDADDTGDADVIIKLIPTPRTMSDGLQILAHLLR
jgi:hypothetical protein